MSVSVTSRPVVTLGLTLTALALFGLPCTDSLPPSPPPPNADAAVVSDPLRHALGTTVSSSVPVRVAGQP